MRPMNAENGLLWMVGYSEVGPKRACGKPQLRCPGQVIAGPEVEPHCRTRCRRNKCQTTGDRLGARRIKVKFWAFEEP